MLGEDKDIVRNSMSNSSMDASDSRPMGKRIASYSETYTC
jgi:hypothetical protein